ncbi:BamA/TamA family outer membrane protein [bacterium]|jgi:outer membrane protein insertion porin family|nr:BamA/TamA family outer membrane protein [bacterium]
MSFARFLFLCVTISLTLSPVYSKSGEKISSLPKKISQSVSPKISDRPAPKGPLVTDILINGNQNTAKQIILVSINTRVGGHLDEETLKNDVKSIYKLGYFQSPPKVLTERFRGGVRLVFTVEENPLVESITLEGNTLLATEDLLKEMTTSPGSVLNIRQLYEDLSLISSLYRKKGYIYSGIYNPGKQVNIEGTKIHIKIHESRISKILVEGNKKTRDYVIMRELLMEEGQIVHRDGVGDSLRNLRNLDYFELEQPEINLDPETGDTNITLRLKDIKTGTASFGGGYSSVNGFVGFVDATERNFRGKGQSLRVKTQFGGEQAYELAFTEPYWRGRRQALGGSIFRTIVDRDQIRPENLNSRFEERREGFSIFSSWRKRKDESTTVRFIDERIKTNVLVGVPELLLNDHQQTIGVTWVRDLRDNFQYPTKGHRHSFTFTTTGGILAGENNFNKYSYDFRKYWDTKFIRKNTLALRTRLGIAQELSGFIPFIDLWSIGGSNSIRGYEDREFVGKKMWYTNLEFRYKLSEQFTAALFTDAGSAWDNFQGFDLKSAYGVGIRFKTPLGPFRLDFARASDRKSNKIHFGIGSMF